jgi:hypothetical protein
LISFNRAMICSSVAGVSNTTVAFLLAASAYTDFTPVNSLTSILMVFTQWLQLMAGML